MFWYRCSCSRRKAARSSIVTLPSDCSNSRRASASPPAVVAARASSAGLTICRMKYRRSPSGISAICTSTWSVPASSWASISPTPRGPTGTTSLRSSTAGLPPRWVIWSAAKSSNPLVGVPPDPTAAVVGPVPAGPPSIGPTVIGRWPELGASFRTSVQARSG